MNDNQETESLQKALAALAAAINKIISESVEHVLTEKQLVKNLINGRESVSTGRILTKKQAAELLHITTRTVEDWMKRGLLPYLKIGRTVRFKEDDLMRHLNDYSLVGHARMNR
jgi:excisionase family DNA binding protein